MPMTAQVDMEHAYVGFTAGSSFVAKAIRKASGGRVNHALLVYYDCEWGTWVDCSAKNRGFYPEHIPSPIGVEGLHSLWRAPTGLRVGMQKNCSLLGRPYDYAGLIGMLPVELAQHAFRLRIKNILQSNHAIFCSESVAKIIKDDTCGPALWANINARERESTIDPEELLVACERTDGWDLIYGSEAYLGVGGGA